MASAAVGSDTASTGASAAGAVTSPEFNPRSLESCYLYNIVLPDASTPNAIKIYLSDGKLYYGRAEFVGKEPYQSVTMKESKRDGSSDEFHTTAINEEMLVWMLKFMEYLFHNPQPFNPPEEKKEADQKTVPTMVKYPMNEHFVEFFNAVCPGTPDNAKPNGDQVYKYIDFITAADYLNIQWVYHELGKILTQQFIRDVSPAELKMILNRDKTSDDTDTASDPATTD